MEGKYMTLSFWRQDREMDKSVPFGDPDIAHYGHEIVMIKTLYI